MENTSIQIHNAVTKEIRDRSLDLANDLIETGLDQIMDEGVLKDLPFINTIKGFYNIANSIVARHSVKKIITFFQTFNAGVIDPVKFNQFLHKFNTDNDYRIEVVDTILLLNERFLKVEKSKILANLVLAHVNGNLTWDEFSDIGHILDGIHPRCFFILKEMSAQPYWKSQIIRSAPDEALVISAGIGLREGSEFIIVELGQKLYNFGLKPSGL